MNHLERIVARTRADVARKRDHVPLAPVADPPPRRPFAEALRRPGLGLIAEHKRSSPSAGVIRDDVTLEEVVGAYERGGAAAPKGGAGRTSSGTSILLWSRRLRPSQVNRVTR